MGKLKDLMQLFDKHGFVVLKGSVKISASPLHIDLHQGLKTRDITLKFTEAVLDNDEAKTHADEYGFIIE